MGYHFFACSSAHSEVVGVELVPERSLSDFESHVYYPRELELLYRHTGFQIESFYGDYHNHPPGPRSPQMIVVGIKPASS